MRECVTRDGIPAVLVNVLFDETSFVQLARLDRHDGLCRWFSGDCEAGEISQTLLRTLHSGHILTCAEHDGRLEGELWGSGRKGEDGAATRSSLSIRPRDASPRRRSPPLNHQLLSSSLSLHHLINNSNGRRRRIRKAKTSYHQGQPRVASPARLGCECIRAVLPATLLTLPPRTQGIKADLKGPARPEPKPKTKAYKTDPHHVPRTAPTVPAATRTLRPRRGGSSKYDEDTDDDGEAGGSSSKKRRAPESSPPRPVYQLKKVAYERAPAGSSTRDRDAPRVTRTDAPLPSREKGKRAMGGKAALVFETGYTHFRPNLTPEEMLRGGMMGGGPFR